MSEGDETYDDIYPEEDGLTEQQKAILALFESDTTPLSAFDLSAAAGRRGFLWRFSEIGEEALFEAFQKVWGQLNAPKAARCTHMALLAGVSGSGKKALLHVLARFLDEFNSIEVPELPAQEDFASFDERNEAALAYFAREDAKARAMLDKYEAILDGRTSPSKPVVTGATILKGPWRPHAPRQRLGDNSRR